MKRFDRLVLAILLISASLIIILLLQGDRVGVQVTATHPADGTEISARGRAGITFDVEMDLDSLKENFTVVPDISGEFQWEGKTLWFLPHEQLKRNQEYQFTVAAEAESLDGRKLMAPVSWSARVREPEILYLTLKEDGGDLWRVDLSTSSPVQLTDTGGGIYDFSPDPTGEWVIYSLKNETRGRDLWIIDRDGLNPSSILSCGQDLCSEAAWSADGAWVAYVRQARDEETGVLQPPRIWSIHVGTGDTAPLYQTPNAFGHSPSFSPDGKRLATYDSVAEAIRVLDLETSQESLIPSLYPGVGDWSPDGQSMVFIDLVPSVLEPLTSVYIVHFDSQTVTPAFRELAEGIDYSQPQWSPDGEWFAVGLRAVTAGISKGLWVQNLDASQAIRITDDAAATFSAYRWDPWGDQLVFQRFGLGVSDQHPALWLWDWETGERLQLVDRGARPEWLP